MRSRHGPCAAAALQGLEQALQKIHAGYRSGFIGGVAHSKKQPDPQEASPEEIQKIPQGGNLRGEPGVIGVEREGGEEGAEGEAGGWTLPGHRAEERQGQEQAQAGFQLAELNIAVVSYDFTAVFNLDAVSPTQQLSKQSG